MTLFAPAHRPPAQYREYDPRWARVARHIMEQADAGDSVVTFEHVGSTAVPGCGGKGIIDMLALYPPGQLDRATAELRRLGLRPQGDDFPHPFPPQRPMYLGSIDLDGETFIVYVHVLATDNPEVERFRVFRERLTEREDLRHAYSRVKRDIINAGITDSDRYRQAKTDVIREILGPEADLD
ncbi:MAG: GrpB family protein [Planctomycetota bacterium]